MNRILVVDDEPALLFLLHCSLERMGFHVRVAKNGSDALAVADRDGPFDLLITDVMMPGMSGGELARDLLERRRASACLLMSGYCSDDGLRGLIDDFELCGFIQKPFLIPDLVKAITRLLANGKQPGVSYRAGPGSADLRVRPKRYPKHPILRRAKAVRRRQSDLIVHTRYVVHAGHALRGKIAANMDKLMMKQGR